MRATWNGAVLAESNDTVLVEGNHYFPRESLAAGETSHDAAWTYHRPSPLARRIKGRYAFWRGVEVSSHGDDAS
jgi:uncharacterized protein (DUF427 family)